jgi:ATP-binding cassette, subfamily C, bacterial
MSARMILPVADGRRCLGALRDLVRGRRPLAAAALVTLVAGTAAGLVVPRVIGHIVDLVVNGRDPGAITAPVVWIVVLAIVQTLLTALGAILVARLGEGMLADLRERVVGRALALPPRVVEEGGTGDLVARVGGDVSVVATAVRTALPEVVSAALVVGLTLVGLAALDWRLALAALLAAPVQVGAARWYLRRSTPIYAAQRAAEGRRTQQLLDSVGGAATVHAFGLTDQHLTAVDGRSRDAVELDLEATRTATRFYGRLNLAELIGLSAILVVGFLLVRADAVTVGAASAAALYFHRLFDPVNALLGLLGETQQAAAGLARLVGVLDIAPDPVSVDAGEPADAGIAVEDVSFAYDGHQVLHDVSLHLAPGEHVALVGASGAGKSTLAGLVTGLHRAGGGRVSIGGVAVDGLDPVLLRRTVAAISQEVHVFTGPLEADLRLAAPEATEGELRKALEVVGATWVDALPEGLATVVGEGGHQLTAAQAQQLAFARLLLADPQVAVLDEATADAGSAGARLLDEVASRVLEGRTALVVAHRLSQAAAADRIVVLDAGRVVEEGSHDELVARGGAYAGMWAAWAGR